MNLVTVRGVSKHYSERQLLNEADLLINEGDRIGLIGVNGSGKTTLLRMLAGAERPSSGEIMIWGKVRVQYLPQNPVLDESLTVLDQVFSSDTPQIRLLRDYEWVSQQLDDAPDDVALQERLLTLSEAMDSTGGWATEANVKAVLTRLGITMFEAKVGTLSGGQRRRVALAQALIAPADLLILDEPTNHIDAETVDWLETYLASTPKALLMVTHDRYFLDRVVNRIVELDRRKLVMYEGNYSRYLEKRAIRHQQLAESEEKRRKLIQRELAWVHRSPMARGTKQKARKQRVEALQEIAFDKGEGQVVMALASRRLGKRVLESEGLSKAYGPLQLFDNVDLNLNPGDRIGLIGPNGAGKSTLLDILAGVSEADSGMVEWGETVRLGYYDQQSRGLAAGMAAGMTVLEFIDEHAPVIRTQDGTRMDATYILDWFLFPRPQQRAKLSSLSGGERRRLYLLSVLVHQPNVLFLDEPTNDLDIQTLTVLESFLDHFKGCLVVVSHDRYFLDRTVDFLATFENGRLSSRYPAPYSSFQQLRQEVTTLAPVAAPVKAKPARTQSRPRKLTWKENQELAGLDEQIEALEMEKDEVQTAVNGVGSDYQQLQTLAERLEEIETELETIMERWLELSEIAEEGG